MSNNQKEPNNDKWLGEMTLSSKSERYQDNEMITCQKCKRNNPPNRLDCMYCGIELKIDESQNDRLKPVLRNIDSYQNGQNLIYTGDVDSWSELQINEVSRMTRLSAENLKKIVKSRKSLPIARVSSTKEIEIAATRLKEIGLESVIISDEKLELDKKPKRLRSLEFGDDILMFGLFNNREVFEIKKDQIALIVKGILFEKKLESTEAYKKKGENKVLENAEISSDEIVIDIYLKEDKVGFRILPKGFDFSPLGKDKHLLARENIKILVNKLKDFAKNAKFDDDYIQIRDSLTEIWELEEVNELKGMKRKSFGSYNKVSVISTDNNLQFTKYSRLQWILLNTD